MPQTALTQLLDITWLVVLLVSVVMLLIKERY